MFDGLVGQFVLVVLNEGLKFHLGNANEWFACRNGSAESELGIAVEHLVGKAVHLGILDLLVGHTAIDQNDLGSKFRPLSFGLFGIGIR